MFSLPVPWNTFFQITPIGAARLVTNEIIAKRNIIVMMAMMFPCCFVLFSIDLYKLFVYSKLINGFLLILLTRVQYD